MSASMFVKQEADFTIHYAENRSHWGVVNHYHADLELILVLEGKLQITINDKTHVAESGTLIFISTLEPHYYSVLELPYVRHVVMFKQSYLSMLANEPVLTSIFNYRPKSFNPLVKLPSDQAEAMRMLFARMQSEFEETPSYWERSIKALLCQLMIDTYRVSEKSFPLSNVSPKSNKKIIIDLQLYIDEHFMEDINLKDMAGMFHTNMYYLCHLFKEITGGTFKNYLIQRRLSYAKDLLSNTAKDVAEIAFEIGFGSANHFIRTFKKTAGVTPYQYRKKSQYGAKPPELARET